MKELVSAHEMRLLEQHMMEEVGVPAVVLMERAALFTFEKLREVLDDKKGRILVACGMGNNGGDGLALARMLAQRNFFVTVVMIGKKEKRSELNALQERIYRSLSQKNQLPELSVEELITRTGTKELAYDVIVDAILGIGVSRSLSGEYAALVECLNQMDSFKLAMDVPTGIHADTGQLLGTCFMADMTTTYGRIKTGLLLGEGKLAAGEVAVDDCGMSDMNWQSDSDCFAMDIEDLTRLVKRHPNGNKGSFGKIGMIVGSQAVPGAALLSVGAAFRSGAGYLQVCTHEDNRALLMEQNPETVLKLYADSVQIESYLGDMLRFADVASIGCGLGVEVAKTVLETLVTEYYEQLKQIKALVLDADALTAIANSEMLKDSLGKLPCHVVLTPHMKEFERLSGIKITDVAENRIAIARSFAKQWHVTLVLKDAQTVVAAPDGMVMINTFGNDGMAVAGSGDVLCGVIAAMIGQTDCVFDAVCAGVTIHAMAGDMARLQSGRHGMLPQDMIRMLPRVIGEMTGSVCDVTMDTD